MNRSVIRYLFSLLILFGATHGALAQTAQFSGQVSDPHQAMVSGAQIRVVNQSTGVKYEVNTNNDGAFVVPFVSPGTYRIYVKSQGFNIAMSEPLTVTVGQEMVFDVQLKVGSVEQTVTVTGGSQLLNISDGSVSTVIDKQFVQDIPLNGRSFQDLISLTPGVITQTPQASGNIGSGGDFSVNGQRTESNNYIVDGLSANFNAVTGSPCCGISGTGTTPAVTALGTTQALVSVDALQEFRVESSSYSAEYGRAPGGQFSFVSRSGTNTYHGTSYEYLRNNYFDANDWFNDHLGKAEAPLRQNDFGGIFGGPVWIPKLYNGKDRTFFFFSYEGLRLMQPQPATEEWVPSLATRTAAVSAIQPILTAFPAPNLGVADTPITCSTANNNTIGLTNGYPCPVVNGVIQTGTKVASGMAPFALPYSLPAHIDAYSIRLDHNISSKMNAFLRFAYTPSVTDSRPQGLSVVQGNQFNSKTYTAGANNSFTSKVSNSFRLGYARNDSNTASTMDSFGGAVPIDFYGAAGISEYPHPEAELYPSVPGVNGAYLLEGTSSNKNMQWNLVETASISLGHHQLKLGADYRHIYSPQGSYDPWTFAMYQSAWQMENNEAHVIDVFVNAPSEPVFNQFALFAQDEWHVAPRLKLSLGLRWDVDPPPHAADGLDAFTLTGSLNDPSSLGFAPRGTPLWKTSYLNFSPRVGVAYQLRTNQDWETVVRAGGGVFFDTDNETALSGFSSVGYYAFKAFKGGYGYPVTPAMITASAPSTSAPYTSTTVYAYPSHLQLPYTLQWNFSVQQALGRAQSLTMSYVGAAGRRLLIWEDYSLTTINPNFAGVKYLAPGATSDYDALQLSFQRNLHYGVQALASYTWSHSIDYGSETGSASAGIDGLLSKRGNSDYDLRHNFVAGLSWNLPNVNGSQIVKQVLSHWGLDGRFVARTGFPVEIQGGSITDSVTGLQTYSGIALNPGVPLYLYGSQYPGGRSINVAAFTQTGSEYVNPAPRNYARGFGENQINLAVRRDFLIVDGLKLQFRAESFNILNHPNFGSISESLTSATFGQATAMLNHSLPTMASQYQQGGPRSMQFALKLLF